MTKPNLTSIHVVMDESASMGHLRKETIEGFNTLVEGQKAVEGQALLSLVKFSNQPTVIYDAVPLETVKPMDDSQYRPSGFTALLDAVGLTITSAGQKFEALPEDERPSKVIVVIVTDGEENASKEYRDAERIRQMVKHQTEVYGWEFVFLGANIDAVQAGADLGVSSLNTVNYQASDKGTRSLYHSVNASLASSRSNASYEAGDFFARSANASLVDKQLVDADGNLIVADNDTV